MSDYHRTTVHIPEDFLEVMDELVDDNRFDSRASFIRDAIREKLNRMEGGVS